MELIITDLNFRNDHDWLFKLKDQEGTIFYIMDSAFYETFNLRSPIIARKHLDYYDIGTHLNAVDVKEVNKKLIVISIDDKTKYR
jgi:hypothetical protein